MHRKGLSAGTRICVTNADPDHQKGPDSSKVTAFVGNGFNRSLHSVEPQFFSLGNKRLEPDDLYAPPHAKMPNPLKY